MVSDTRESGGASRDRTDDPLLAKQVLSQLSYGPFWKLVGLGRVELPTSPLSGVRSNQLSYRPVTHEPTHESWIEGSAIGTVPGTAQATCVGRSQ